MSNGYSNLVLANESDVEQKFIFPLLTNPEPIGLGFHSSDFWTKGDIRQFLVDKGNKKKLYYPDYAVVIDGLPCLIIEAKAPGADLVEASREGRLYATEVNASYPHDVNPCELVLVTDGLILVLYSWDSDNEVLRLKGEDLDSMNQLFSELLGRISKRSLQRLSDSVLKKLRGTAKFFKPTHMLGGKTIISETVSDNSFGSNISIEYRYLFNPDSSEDRASVVRNAYVTSKRKQGHVAPIDKLIRTALQVDFCQIDDTSNPREILEQVSRTNQVKNEILLLIGSVGSGKSTFTDYLRLVALDQPLSKKIEWINLNLNKAPLNRELIYDWVLKKAIESLEQLHTTVDFYDIAFLKKIYAADIARVKRGKAALYAEGSEKHTDIIAAEIDRLQSDKVATLQAIIQYFFNMHEKLLVIVLDNCDKGNRNDQLLMFEVASWLKDNFTCMVFLPLRDTTYDQFKNEPPLDTVIKDLVFRIDPPLLEKVIYARLNYALRQIEVQNGKFSYTLKNGMRVECTRREVGQYLKSMIATLFQDQLFRRIITGIAGRNIRKGLEILLDFCKSGYVSEEEILKVRTTSGEYKIPNQLVMKILLKGKRKYYTDLNSNVRNAFHSEQIDPIPDPFSRLDILQWLKDNYRIAGPSRMQGFHKIDELIRDLQAHGHNEKTILKQIRSLVNAGCISAESQTADVSEDDLICISPAGFVHLDLVKNISYLSTVSEDVLFRENQIAKKIADNISGQGKFNLDSRQSAIANSKILADYLISYRERHFPRNISMLTDERNVKLYDFSALQDYVNQSAENDPHFRTALQIEQDYPIGSIFEAQINSIRDYGFFVEFGAYGHGLIHKSQLTQSKLTVNDFESGEWVSVQILGYSDQRKNFDLKLIPSDLSMSLNS